MNNKLFFISKLICSIILLQTLYFKFTGAEESVYIFTTVGMEPVRRIGSGIAELIAAILLLTRRWDWLGAFIAIGTMSGAIFFHLTKLGIEVKGDGGYLFALALVVFIISAVVLFVRRAEIPILNKILTK